MNVFLWGVTFGRYVQFFVPVIGFFVESVSDCCGGYSSPRVFGGLAVCGG